ncbi:hypothetical protein NLJ89_g8659 [Agrocybe chaxingu]|uniref:Uncharacterized protein n=1 Tax=Agrocybe chaxingu TaxID=84603 RepID=A0A9W8MTW0_9AGAR|nr:hypothetical protein NLJ89_g8659 [Agrocybe chaxingu]
MHLPSDTINSTPRENASSDGAAPSPPADNTGRIDTPVVPDAPSSPVAVADGVFLPSLGPRATSESEDIDGVAAADCCDPTCNALNSLRLGAAAARLACLEVAFSRSSALIASISPAPAFAAGPPQTPRRPTLTASPVAGPSTSRLQHTGTRPQAEASTSSAIRLQQIRVALSPEPEEHRFEDALVPFEITPGRHGNPIYISSRDTTPYGTPAPAQQVDDTANNSQPAPEHSSVAVQTDPVYVLSRFSTPEPLPFWVSNPFHSGTPETDSSLDTPGSTRRSRQEFESDGEPHPERPSLRRRIEEILSSMESPPPSPPGPSRARTRIRPSNKKRTYLTERPDEFGPAYLVKVVDSSDEEYQSRPGFPQAPNSATASDPATQSNATGSGSSTSLAGTSAISSAMDYTGTETSVLSSPHANASANRSDLPSPSNILDSDDEYPDMFDFDDAIVNDLVDEALGRAQAGGGQEPKANDKGKGVAR